MSRSPMSIAVAESMRWVPRINEPSTALPDSTAILNRCYGRRLAPIRCDGSGRGGGWVGARRGGRQVPLREHGGQAGRKILISGGGRCNFTNLHCGPQNFISENR